MNKIKKLFAFIVAFLGLISLASCGKSFEATIEKITPTRDSITIEVSFGSDKEIIDGKAVPIAKIFEVDKDEEKYVEKDQTVTLNARKDGGSASFSDLKTGQEYVIYLYMRYNGSENKVGEGKKVTTLKNGTSEDDPIIISTVDEFLAMGKDNKGYYKLANDIDFEDAQITDMFSSSNPFKGHFDGNGKTISNFKIKSATNAGIFGQTEKATIKNLNIKNAQIDWSNGRSSSNAAILVGRAIDTVIRNITIDGVKIDVSANTSAEINLGVLVGLSENTSVKDVKITNANINLIRSRLKVTAGLVFGTLKGVGIDDVFVENVYAEGTIEATAYYNNSEGYTFIGGFAGGIGAIGKVKDSAVIATINVYKEVNTQYTDDYYLAVGGFIGMNSQGQMNIEKCAAISDITIMAGKKPAEGSTGEEYKDAQMSKKPIYVGGFIGNAKKLFIGILDCQAKVRKDGITIQAKESITEEDKTTKLVYQGEFEGFTDAPDYIKNSTTPVELDPTVKSMLETGKLA